MDQQAALDQMWASLEENEPTLLQIQGCMDQRGIMASYLAILITQLKQNKHNRENV